jgi:Tol biopolymer transport system component
MDRLTREERRYMLLHELAHLKHRDTCINWLVSLLRVLHWFNPLVWYAFHRVRLDRELACDELVLAITEGKGKDVYGQTIIKLLEQRFGPVRNPALTGIVETKDQIERRIDMIAKFKLITGRPLVAALLFAGLAAVTLTDAQTERETKSSTSYGITKTDLSGQPGGRQPVTTAQVGATSASKSLDAEFPVVARFSGANDVIQATASLNVSPNGKFLLWRVTVVPVGGGEPFKLTDIAGAGGGSWSPDGAKVVFYAGPIWMIAVSAETGKPAGPAKKLLDGDYWAYARVRWSPDSQHIVFEGDGPEVGGSVCVVSVSDGRLKRLTTEPGRHRFPVWSSDGRTILYSKEGSLFQIPAEGGAAKKLAVNGDPIGWSADAKWLVLAARKQLLFHNVDSGETRQAEFLVEAGECVAKSLSGKLLFYRPSYDYSLNSKVVDVSGARPSTVQQNIEIYTWIWQDCWTRDSKNLIGLATSDDKMQLIPATGGQLKTIQLDVSTDGEIVHRFPSPDLRRLLFSVKREPGSHDLWVVPLSLQQLRTVGKPVKILTGCKVPDILGGPRWGVWSPDSKRIAVYNGNDLWVVSATGKEARPITAGPGRKSYPAWSPNGQMIAYVQHEDAPLSLRVVAASGGQAKTLNIPAGAESHLTKGTGEYIWSRDGKEVLFTTGRGISAVNVATGKTRQVVDLTELGEGYARTLRWPPGKDYLCFLWTSEAQEDGLSTLYRVRPQSRTLEKIADGILVGYSWSPDGRKVAYDTLTFSKNRPEGLLREFDLEAKLAALAR